LIFANNSSAKNVSENGEKIALIIPKLLEYSDATRWADAKFEWRLNHIWYADIEDARTCECGHYPICEICVVENVVNGTSLEIGNCCVNQVSPEFETLKRIFPALREGRINPAIIDYAYRQELINDWEKEFLQDVWRKRSRTPKQFAKFKQIRHKIYENIQISQKQRLAIYDKWRTEEEVNDLAAETVHNEATAQ
jgi:hypothetical protein